MAEPIFWLRSVNAVFSVIFVPLIWYVVWVSRHASSAFYRYGMMAISAGLCCNVFMVVGLLPVNIEWWMLKDVGIYAAVLKIAIDYRREHR